jgi:hypothetical protein
LHADAARPVIQVGGAGDGEEEVDTQAGRASGVRGKDSRGRLVRLVAGRDGQAQGCGAGAAAAAAG